jgi:hypothetical protein
MDVGIISVFSAQNLYETGSQLNLFINQVVDGTFMNTLAEKLQKNGLKDLRMTKLSC